MLDGASQIAVPTFVATLAICIVFVPVLLLTGTARYLFTPLAMAVVFAMLASYLLSRTLVPTMMAYLLESEAAAHEPRRRSLFQRGHQLFNAAFEALRFRYVGLLDWSLRHRGRRPGSVRDFLRGLARPGAGWWARISSRQWIPARCGCTPAVRRARASKRPKCGSRQFEREIRAAIPPDEIEMLIDNIGIPNSWPSIAQGDIPTISSADGEILISLNKEKHAPTRDYEVLLRKRLHEHFPDMTFFFQPANITSQILNFGLPAPIDVQVVGRNAEANYEIAQKLARRIAHIPGAADVHVHQVADQPEIRLDVDRAKASQMGLTQRDVTSSMLISLSGSGTVAPNFWMNWTNGINYNIGVQTPQYRIDSLDALLRTPISASTNAQVATTAGSQSGASTAGVASVGASPNGASQAYGNPGSAAGGTQLLSNLVSVQTVVHARHRQPLQCLARLRCVCQCGPARSGRRGRGSRKDHARGGAASAARHFVRAPRPVGYDAVVLLPPGAGAGVCRSPGLPADDRQLPILGGPLHHPDGPAGSDRGYIMDAVLTGTTLSVPSLMGAMMCIGVATANSILIVTFANDEREMLLTAREAMLSAGYARVRPVLMTATAMILGMVPMALAMGEGGEQNAPLGRAVIGGLMFATVTTLFVVPIIYTYLRKNPPVDHQRRLEELNTSQ